MRAILMFHNCEGHSHTTASTDHNFRRERRAETDSNRGPPAYKPNALPLGQTGSPAIYIYIYIYQRSTNSNVDSNTHRIVVLMEICKAPTSRF